jgi:hypothetical protein
MDWSIYQYLHMEARKLYGSGSSVLISKVIDLDELRKLFDENAT